MLTKDLLRFSRNRQAQVFPRFLKADDRITLDLVESLANLYQNGIDQSREELSELAHPIINGHRSPLIAKGINKLLLDRCLFQEPDSNIEPFRAQVYATAAHWLIKDDPELDSLSHFRSVVGQRHDQPADELAAALHADLPIRQPLRSFETVSAEKLIHRYNLAQAQGLLFNSNKMTLTFTDTDVGRRRFFFRYLRFFRLLARVHKTGPGQYRLEVDGPLSLFDQTRKYGIRMANLLPVICLLSQWSLTASVKPEKQSGTLKLDHNDGLISHYRLTTAYVPEEFKIFAEQFKKAKTEWKISNNPPLLDLGKQELSIPDFSFVHQRGTVVHLELFHRWHKGALQQRLKQVALGRKKINLAIGIDRFLNKDPSLAKQLEQSGWFQKHGLSFNAFPPVGRVVKTLEGFLEEPNKESTL
ncbi:MAG: DUF790 family protein [Magnetococcales bacterium]|nr:DUF790 family protein [Magnetococcales bacterium]